MRRPSKFFVKFTALAEVPAKTVVEAADLAEARDKAFQAARHEKLVWEYHKTLPRLIEVVAIDETKQEPD